MVLKRERLRFSRIMARLRLTCGKMMKGNGKKSEKLLLATNNKTHLLIWVPYNRQKTTLETLCSKRENMITYSTLN